MEWSGSNEEGSITKEEESLKGEVVISDITDMAMVRIPNKQVLEQG